MYVDNIIGTVSAAMTNAALNMSESLVGTGGTILAALLGCMIAYYLLMSLVGEDWAMTQVNLMQLVIKWGIVTFMLLNWKWLGETFVASFKIMALQIGGGSSSESIVDLGLAAIKNLFAIGQVEPGTDTPCSIMGCRPTTINSTDESTISRLLSWNWWKETVSVGLASFNLLMGIIALIIKVFAAISIALLMFAVSIVSVLGLLTMGIGLAIGPILVPFLIVPPLSYLFIGWIRFMISSGLVMLVSAAVVVIVSTVFKELNLISNYSNNGTELGVNLVVLFTIPTISAMGIYLALKAPEFANSLISGNALSGSNFVSKQIKP